MNKVFVKINPKGHGSQVVPVIDELKINGNVIPCVELVDVTARSGGGSQVTLVFYAESVCFLESSEDSDESLPGQ